MNEMHLARREADAQLEARIQSLEVAFRMQTAAVEARDLYGTGQFADACLVGRRLLERGVRMVQLFHGGGQPWDSHSDLEKSHRNLAQQSDRPIAALLRDLKSRG